MRSHLNIQLTGKPTSKSWILRKSIEKQKWCDVAGTATFCPEAVSEAWDAGTGWATEAGTEELTARMNIRIPKKKFHLVTVSLKLFTSLTGVSFTLSIAL